LFDASVFWRGLGWGVVDGFLVIAVIVFYLVLQYWILLELQSMIDFNRGLRSRTWCSVRNRWRNFAANETPESRIRWLASTVLTPTYEHTGILHTPHITPPRKINLFGLFQLSTSSRFVPRKNDFDDIQWFLEDMEGTHTFLERSQLKTFLFNDESGSWLSIKSNYTKANWYKQVNYQYDISHTKRHSDQNESFSFQAQAKK
jgi:hypothetical protein